MSARVPLILRVPRRLYHHVSRPSTVASSIFRIPYRQQLRESGLLYASLPRQVAVAHDEQIDRLCLLFDLAAQAPLPVFVLGPSEKLWLPTMLHNFGMLNVSKPNLDRLLSNPKWVDPTWKQSPGELQAHDLLLREQQQHLQESSGSILTELAYWSLAANDAAVFGAVAGRKELHIAIPDTPVKTWASEILFDSRENRPTVLTRELHLLARNGYRMADHPYPDAGVVLGNDTDRQVNLREALRAAEQIRSLDDAYEAVKELEPPGRR